MTAPLTEIDFLKRQRNDALDALAKANGNLQALGKLLAEEQQARLQLQQELMKLRDETKPAKTQKEKTK